jgi:polysaccharide export outer membrane protein
MKAQAHTWRTGRLRDILPPAGRLPALFLAVAAAAMVTAEIGARAEETGNDPGQAATYAEAISNAAPVDYRLAPGDHLTLVVYDQPQLSGEFIVDGGGGIILPVAGSVNLSGLTLAEAQKLIQERFGDGVLLKPSVSLRIKEHRPIFVTGHVKKPGSYPFVFGASVKAAIATAGGEGQSLDQPFSTVVSDFISAEHRVRQLEADQTTLLMRKARLEAQRDRREIFVIPMLVGFTRRNVEFDRAYAVENDTFSRLAETHRRQVQSLQEQRPRIQEEIDAVNSQITKQRERLDIVIDRLTDLDILFGKGLLRKEVLINQQIEKALVESQLSNLEAQVARLRQNMGELEFKLGELKALNERETLRELLEASQRLAEIENGLAPARKLLQVRAQAAESDTEATDYKILISRVRDGRLVTFDAANDTMLSPGDVVEVKLKRRTPGELPSLLNQAAQSDAEPEPFVTGATAAK